MLTISLEPGQTWQARNGAKITIERTQLDKWRGCIIAFANGHDKDGKPINNGLFLAQDIEDNCTLVTK